MNQTVIENPDENSEIKKWLKILQDACLTGKTPISWPEATFESNDWKQLIEDQISIQNFILQMAGGDLTSTLKAKGVMADSLKTLQSRLRQFTWQVQKVTAGNLTQKIDFIDDLATAFEQMTQIVNKTRTELLESESRYSLLAENVADVIWTMDLNGKFTYVSPSVMRLRGFTPDEAMAQSIDASLTPSSAQKVREQMKQLMAKNAKDEGEEAGVYELEQPRKDGSTIWIEVAVSGLYDANGNLVGFLGASRDITERLNAQKSEHDERILAEALSNTAAAINSAKNLDEVFDSLLENIGHAIPHASIDILTVDSAGIATVKRSAGYPKYIHDAPSKLSAESLPVDITPNLRTMRDTGRSYMIHNLSDFNWVETDTTQWARSHLGTPILVKGKVDGFIILLSKDPDFFTEEHALHLRAFADLAALAIDKANLSEQLNELATIDSLTGIANRRHFFNLAEQEITRAVRYKRPLAALVMDIDNFKQVNDTFGHNIGDELLVEIAKRCQQELRRADLVGRYGGEEFSFILPETDANSALIVADRLQKVISNTPFLAHREAVKVTVSIGVTGFKPTIPSARALLDQAEQALYRAKQSGRKNVARLG